MDGVINHSTAIGKVHDKAVLKFDFAIGNGDDIYYLGETYSKNEDDKDILRFLDKLQTSVQKRIDKKKFETNDDITLYIQRKCIDNNCYPIENCKSYQYHDRMLYSENSKYIMCNFVKYYDEEDRLVMDNLCFDLEDNETYILNISIVKDSDIPKVYTVEETPQLGFFNDNVYLLKLKSSREFFSRVKTLNGRRVFFLDAFNTAKDKVGKKECINNCILEGLYPESCNQVVYSKKFAITIHR
jgi:hypothetical protein